MRYSTFLKFIAVILCAASLLGMAGSVAGILILTEQGGKSVDAEYEEQLRNQSGGYAMVVGSIYASEHLGGAHRNLINQHYGNDWQNRYFDWTKVEYTLYDSQGNAVMKQEMAEDSQGNNWIFDDIPVSGQYIKVVRTMTEEEHYLQRYKVELSQNGYVQVMPAQESTAIGAVFADYTDGHTEHWPADGTQLGVLHYTGGKSISFLSNIGEIPLGDGWYPCHIRMLDMGGNVTYEVDGETNVILGMTVNPDGVVEIQLPASPVITPAMVSMNVTRENYRAYGAILPQGTTVSQMTMTFANARGEPQGREGISAPDLLGILFLDKEGNPEFHSREPMTMDIPENSIITHISFQDAQGNVVFEADCPDGVGRIKYDNNGNLIFQGEIPERERTEITDEPAAEKVEGQTGFAKENIPVYRAPSVESGEIGMLEAWQEIRITRLDYFNGEAWGLIADGWIRMENVLLTEAALSKTTEETAPAERESMQEGTEATLPVPEAVAVPAVTDAAPEAAAEPTEETYALANYYDSALKQEMVAEYVMEPIPEGYTMQMRLAHGALRNELGWALLRIVDRFRSQLVKILGSCILLFVLCVIHLCCSAGRTRRNYEVRAGGLNRIPLDLYFLAGGVGIVGLTASAVLGSRYFVRNDEQLAVLFCVVCGYLVCLVLVGFLFAFVAQTKTPGGYWWRNSVCGRCLKWAVVLGKWLTNMIRKYSIPMTVKMLCHLWQNGKKLSLWVWDTGKKAGFRIVSVVKRMLLWSSGRLARFFGLIPITWQFLLTGFTLVFLLYVVLRSYKIGWILLGFGLFFATILYAASAFAILLESAKRMSRGDLDTKVDDRMLIGGFKEFSGELNNLADVAVVAAQKQLKSERMKTELITNVSHDIKTPLTSIINYVDLMQKSHTEEERVQYLEVLDRQSQRLKKLVDDLMEMSKASTGNMSVDIGRMNAGEAVNQALGEFADKLESARLIPVFRQPDEKVEMMADGRLVWRVMSNLLGNAVKYALPGTRIYVDLLEMDGKVIISMKNISREELNIQAEELLERFVRGDVSRNTEGSGLGLNIAKSLMELQKGKMEIKVDGDLFKVTLIFSGV